MSAPRRAAHHRREALHRIGPHLIVAAELHTPHAKGIEHLAAGIAVAQRDGGLKRGQIMLDIGIECLPVGSAMLVVIDGGAMPKAPAVEIKAAVQLCVGAVVRDSAVFVAGSAGHGLVLTPRLSSSDSVRQGCALLVLSFCIKEISA